VTLLCQRKQKFELVDQESLTVPALRISRSRTTNRQKVATNDHRRCAQMGSFHFPMARSYNPIDRISVSQHETALLIS
jgi:hypothetical protein